MSRLLESVNQHTQLVGENRLELLLFRLHTNQLFGINVFKVKEVLPCPKLTKLPKLNPYVCGIAHIRGQTISIIDLNAATGGEPVQNTEDYFVIISEYNRSVQGFLVSSVERIINTNWEDIIHPPKATSRYSYLTAVTQHEGELIEILDVEKIFDEINHVFTGLSDAAQEDIHIDMEKAHRIMVVDDSAVARKQILKALIPLSLDIEVAKDGKEAFEKLNEYTLEHDNVADYIPLIISDIEMPEMDGYTLTAKIKNNQSLKDITIVLHTSLSGVFNQAMIEKVNANDFIAKFSPDELAAVVNHYLSLQS